MVVTGSIFGRSKRNKKKEYNNKIKWFLLVGWFGFAKEQCGIL